MKDRESMIAAATVIILVLIWIAGSITPDLRFAGSTLGGILALSGAFLMLTPLLLLAVKRSAWIKSKVTPHIPMRTVLLWHIYASFLGSILILLHTGHKFDSVLASTLFALTLAVIFSGVVGRYLQRQIGEDVRSKRKLLDQLYDEYDSLLTSSSELATAQEQLNPASRRIRALVMARSSGASPGTYTLAQVVGVVSSIADVESAISGRESLKKWFTLWFHTHYTLVIIMYLLLALHVWSAIHFGIRWFS